MRAKTGKDKECPCGRAFYCPGWASDRKKYCSVLCRVTYRLYAHRCSEETKKKIGDANRGHVMSQVQKDYISKMWKGKKRSKEFCEKMRLTAKRGAESPAWRGGLTPKNKIIRKSYQYKEWRTAVFERDDYTCVECNTRGVSLHADHIKPFAFFPELRFELSNGRTMCVPCHEQTPTYKKHTYVGS